MSQPRLVIGWEFIKSKKDEEERESAHTPLALPSGTVPSREAHVFPLQIHQQS